MTQFDVLLSVAKGNLTSYAISKDTGIPRRRVVVALHRLSVQGYLIHESLKQQPHKYTMTSKARVHLGGKA